MEPKAFSELSAEEQVDHVKKLESQVEHKDDEHKQAMDVEKKKHESALKAMEDEKKKEAMEEEKKNHDAMEENHKKLEAAILKAMEDHPDDKDKREAAIRSAMEEHMTKKDEGKDVATAMHEDEEKKALKAQVTYLTAQANKPKIEYLAAIYKAAGVEEKTITEYTADWTKLNGEQLDGAIEKVKPLIENIPEFQANKEEKKPFGFSTTEIPTELSGAVGNDKRMDKIEKMSDSELFESDGGIYS